MDDNWFELRVKELKVQGSSPGKEKKLTTIKILTFVIKNKNKNKKQKEMDDKPQLAMNNSSCIKPQKRQDIFW